MTEITNNIIETLLSKYTNHTINNNVFIFIGKGGDGIIYKYDNKILKIYTRNQIDLVIRELYVLNLIKDLSKTSLFNNNIIEICKYNLTLNNPIVFIPVMDGNLIDWCKNINNLVLNQDDIDKYWRSMIFQVTYGLCYVNGLNILHNDAKPKNILYKKNASQNNNMIYEINDKQYSIDNNYIFYVADFGAVQILGSKQNKLSDNDIKHKLLHKSDLYELSKLIDRILVDYALNDYHFDALLKLDKSNQINHIRNQFKQDKGLMNLPNKIKDNMMKRSLIYYLIENNIIDKKILASKHNFKLPSNKIMNILNKLIEDNENIFELFSLT